MKRSYRFFGVSLTALLIACGTALAPIWTWQSNQYQSLAYSYLSDDDESIFIIKYSNGSHLADVEQVSISGEQIQSWLIDSVPILFPIRKLHKLSHNKVFLVSVATGQIMYFDPNDGSYWIGADTSFLETNQTLLIEDSLINSDEKLVVSATLYSVSIEDGNVAIENRVPILLIINQAGEVEQFQEFSQFQKLDLFQYQNNLIIAADYREELRQETAMMSSIVHMDEQLNSLGHYDLEFELNAKNLHQGELLGYLHYTTGTELLRISLTGQLLDQFPFQDADQSFYPNDSGFYTVKRVDIPAESNLVRIYDQAREVCFYTDNYTEQWCKRFTEKREIFTHSSVEVLEDGNIGFSTFEKTDRVSGIELSLDAIAEAIQGGVELTGEEKRIIKHYVFNPQGEKLVEIRDQYSHTGTWQLPSLFAHPVVSEDNVKPGSCSVPQTYFLPENRVLALADYCEGLGWSTRRNQLSLWQW